MRVLQQEQKRQLNDRGEALLNAAPKVPRTPTRTELLKSMPNVPKNDPLIALLEGAKVPKDDPEIGSKVRYINIAASRAISAVTKGMSKEELHQFKRAMMEDASARKKSGANAGSLFARLMKLNASTLDPAIGAKIKQVQDSIKAAYLEMTQDLKNDPLKQAQLNQALKNDVASKRRPR